MSEDFLSRWSRRKRDVRCAEAAEPAAAPAPELPRPQGADLPIEPAGLPDAPADAAALTEEEIAQLPKPEELTVESDVALFLRKGVPETLRNAALRRMWSLDPAIRDYVGDARDYAYDWNVPGGVPGTGPLSPSEMMNELARISGGSGKPEAALSTRLDPGPASQDREQAHDAHSIGSLSDEVSGAAAQQDVRDNDGANLGKDSDRPTVGLQGPAPSGGAFLDAVHRKDLAREPATVAPRRHGRAKPV